MEEKDKMYFGHPVNFYNTPKELELIAIIKRKFPSFTIENPNQRHHQENYQRYKRVGGNGMDYYFKEVLPRMKSGIFLSFEDGKFGAGVFGEAKFLKERGRIIYEITPEGKIDFMPIDFSRMLSVEETRKRVYPNPPKN